MTSPSSPKVHVTSVTAAPSAAYLAIVTPLLIDSSSGWAWTNNSRRWWEGRLIRRDYVATTSHLLEDPVTAVLRVPRHQPADG